MHNIFEIIERIMNGMDESINEYGVDYTCLSLYMRDLIAETQGEIFKYAESKGYDMVDYIEKYMRSDFCNREMDSECSYFHFKTAEVCFPYIEKEIGEGRTTGSLIEGSEWVGRIYRYLVFALKMPSKKLIEIIKPKDLDDMYYEYEFDEIEDIIRSLCKKYNL